MHTCHTPLLLLSPESTYGDTDGDKLVRRGTNGDWLVCYIGSEGLHSSGSHLTGATGSPKDPSVSVNNRQVMRATGSLTESIGVHRLSKGIHRCPLHFATAADQSCRLEEGCSSARRAPSSYNGSSSFPQQSAGYAWGGAMITWRGLQ